jgi:hypothetical protein
MIGVIDYAKCGGVAMLQLATKPFRGKFICISGIAHSTGAGVHFTCGEDCPAQPERHFLVMAPADTLSPSQRKHDGSRSRC